MTRQIQISLIAIFVGTAFTGCSGGGAVPPPADHVLHTFYVNNAPIPAAGMNYRLVLKAPPETDITPQESSAIDNGGGSFLKNYKFNNVFMFKNTPYTATIWVYELTNPVNASLYWTGNEPYYANDASAEWTLNLGPPPPMP